MKTALRDDRHQIDDFSVEQWDNAMNTNLRLHFFTAQMVVEGMRAKDDDRPILDC